MLPNKGYSVIEIKASTSRLRDKEQKLKKGVIVSNAIQCMILFKEAFISEITKYIYAFLEILVLLCSLFTKYLDKVILRRPKEQTKGINVKVRVSKKLTAILDLDHTLIFSSLKKIENKKDYMIIQNKYYVYKRPDLDKFLYSLSQFCEVIIYTSSTKDYADSIINYIDKKKVVQRRFYRDDCVKINENYFKDAKKHGFKVDNLVIVDDMPECHLNYKENVIQVPKWKGENEDNSLSGVVNTIKKIVMKM